eukprot:gene2225-17829_t
MVQLMKRLLRQRLGKAKLNFEELTTVIAEVEGTINSRHLADLNPGDFEEPLTPAQLVIGRRILTLPSQEEFDEDDEYLQQCGEACSIFTHTSGTFLAPLFLTNFSIK